MYSRVIVVLALLGERTTFASNDANNAVEPEGNRQRLFSKRTLLKRKSDVDNDSPSLPCVDTPGYTDFFGNGCEWFENNDAPGCPTYGALFGVDDHCCYCKSNSTSSLMPSDSHFENATRIPTSIPSLPHANNTLSSENATQFPTRVPSFAPSTSPSDNTLDKTSIFLTQAPSLHSSAVPSDAPTKQFLPGELLLTDKKLGIAMSAGLEAKLVAATGKQLELVDGKKSSLPFHSRMDGAGVIDLGDRGWVYVSNSEETAGGVYGLQFNLEGDIVDYKALLTNTRRNCGGGLTPWNSWISCEEWKRGQCWQVAADPTHPNYLSAQQTMIGESGGRFESVATDNRNEHSPVFFATEDSKFGALRRFEAKSNGWQSLHEDGDISYLILIDDKNFEWTKNLTAARESANAYYQNSEGVSFNDGTLYFTAKSTQKLYALDLESMTYQLETTGLNFQGKGSFNARPDQVINGNKRYLYFSESGGNTPGVYVRDMHTGRYMTLFEATDESYLNDETVGIAFSPDRVRMYAGYQGAGVLFEFRRIDGLPFP